MDQDQQLINASQVGDVDTLYALIQKDSYVLEHIDKLPFANSPLHFAASAGCTEFAMEIMKLMPSFAWKLNQDGFSPIHLALQNEQSQVVLGLLQLDGLLVRIKGRQGITPLHYVARSGNINLLAAFLSVCPKSIEDVTSRNETALHIALRSNMYEAFQFLLHWVCHEEDFYLKKKFLDHKDVEGNTLLHIATSRNQPQVCIFFSLVSPSLGRL
ncbi:hypothetical protein P3X46_029776 [Hevea brasiliensis]|uniref:PGG domain-containing protein n=1 Tax=Hevea brasiliensis TaxID=3981 RepID=A0ABQ9KU58_HEVBR|nr:hypothetical protein P3X46_029776 [Hevea brasiliensis]